MANLRYLVLRIQMKNSSAGGTRYFTTKRLKAGRESKGSWAPEQAKIIRCQERCLAVFSNFTSCFGVVEFRRRSQQGPGEYLLESFLDCARQRGHRRTARRRRLRRCGKKYTGPYRGITAAANPHAYQVGAG